jgi:hypothetical protein
MKTSTANLIIISFFLLLTVGCKKNYSISDKQAILFQFDYLNYAWGYDHNGFIIDNQGNIYIYSNPENWNFPDTEFSLSENQVTENINKCTRTGKTLPKEELQKYTGYIKNIASSKVTALKNVAADAGSLEYICYMYSESTGMYKGYLVKMEGDFTCENLNFYSKRVALWMKEIKNSISID